MHSAYAQARGALAIFNDMPAEHIDSYERWNTAEHLPERLAVPGFRRGRRFSATAGSRPDYFTLYDTDDVDVLRSDGYLARLNAPTPRSVVAFGQMRNPSRTAAAVRMRRGLGSGAVVATWRLGATADRRPAFMAWLSTEAMDVSLSVEGVVSALVLEGDAAVTGIDTAEKGTRPGEDECCDLLLVIEGHSVAAVGEACQRLEPMPAHGAADVGRLSFFALQVECLPPADRPTCS